MEDRAIQVTRKDVKNIYLKVSREGHVSVTAPRRMTREEIDAFIKSHEGWISKKVAEMAVRRGGEFSYVTGEEIPLWGGTCTLIVETGSKRDETVLSRGNAPFAGAGGHGADPDHPVMTLYLKHPCGRDEREDMVRKCYKKCVEMEVMRRLPYWEKKTGMHASGFTVRDMKTRWGSCNVKTHHLSLSLSLAMHPLECLDYILVHELSHTREAGHNERFWALVGRYIPDWKRIRKELNG